MYQNRGRSGGDKRKRPGDIDARGAGTPEQTFPLNLFTAASTEADDN